MNPTARKCQPSLLRGSVPWLHPATELERQAIGLLADEGPQFREPLSNAGHVAHHRVYSTDEGAGG
jgi:hypothetical protein